MMRTVADPAATPAEELCDAVRARDIALVRRLLDAGSDPNGKDERLGGDCAPALHDAASLGQCEVIALLLRAGSDVNAPSGSGWTALVRACDDGALDAARMLLDAGADPSARNDEGYTASGRIPGTCPELAALLRGD
jgi:ankyrin repeat protein